MIKKTAKVLMVLAMIVGVLFSFVNLTSVKVKGEATQCVKEEQIHDVYWRMVWIGVYCDGKGQGCYTFAPVQ